MNELDGMRFLGVDPTQPRDELEEMLMLALHNQIVREHDRMESRAR